MAATALLLTLLCCGPQAFCFLKSPPKFEEIVQVGVIKNYYFWCRQSHYHDRGNARFLSQSLQVESQLTHKATDKIFS